ncbi:MAG: HAMP domain-containing protein [Chloroflexi bacterium]|nr:HAMP domain-containing protein [Chloroflexota bacterium]
MKLLPQLRLPKLSFRQRIALSVALGLSVVLAMLSYAALWALQQSTDAAFRDRKILAQNVASHVDEAIARPYEILQRTAGLAGIDLEDGDLAPEKYTIRETHLQMGSFSTITLLDAEGTVLWAESRPQDFVGSNLGWHSGAMQAKRTGEPAIAELPVLPGEPPQICLAVPIRGENGALTGILMAELHPRDKVIRLLPRVPLGVSTSTELVNGQGVVVTSSHDRDGVWRSPHTDSLPQLKQAGVVDHTDARGGRHIVAYAPLATLPEWGVEVEQSEDVVLALPNSLLQRILLLGVVAVAAGVALAWVDVRRVVAPLATLTAAAARMGAGDLDSPIVLRHEGEIGVLANALERTRAKLRDLLEDRQRWSLELERRVEQRTRELSSLYEEVQRKEAVRGELLAKLITAQEEERRRIARELHDESAQSLTALMMAVENAEESLPELSDAQKHRLERAKTLVVHALGDVRRLIWDLRPSVLDDLGLGPAVRWFAEQHLEGVSVEVDVETDQPHRRLPPVVETEVYRILQEAITNVARHARASRLRVCLRHDDSRLVAIAEDDGIGFDAGQVGQLPPHRGLGLLGMLERASILGGTLNVESSPGTGTRLTLDIPIVRGEDET